MAGKLHRKLKCHAWWSVVESLKHSCSATRLAAPALTAKRQHDSLRQQPLQWQAGERAPIS